MKHLRQEAGMDEFEQRVRDDIVNGTLYMLRLDAETLLAQRTNLRAALEKLIAWRGTQREEAAWDLARTVLFGKSPNTPSPTGESHG
jgi:hypothetical protein